MKRLILFLALLVVACGGDSPTAPIPSGTLAIGLLSGDNQIANAGAPQLPAPVVGRLVRTPSGSVAWIQSTASNAVDLIVPRAYGQTVVTGSPVPGAVVCAVSIDPDHSLTPFVPCTNTDSAGKATFYFTPSTRAGVARAEIRGSLNGAPAVFDTATAIVVPDTGSLNVALNFSALGSVVYAKDGSSTYPAIRRIAGDSINIAAAIDSVVDKYGNKGTQTGSIAWKATQMTEQTFTTSGNPDSLSTAALPYPPDPPTPSLVGSTTGPVATGWAPGYASLEIYYSGKLQTRVTLAVFP